MAQRSNHYEAAFEAFIRSIRVPCVAVDEAKRAIGGDDGAQEPRLPAVPAVWIEPGRRGEREARQGWPGAPGLGELGHDRRPRWAVAGGRRCSGRVSGQSWPSRMPSRFSRFRCREPTGPTSSAGSSTVSGQSASTITSPICARGGQRGKRSRWPARAFRRRVRPLLEWLPMSYDWCRRPIPVKERQR